MTDISRVFRDDRMPNIQYFITPSHIVIQLSSTVVRRGELLTVVAGNRRYIFTRISQFAIDRDHGRGQFARGVQRGRSP